MHILVSNDDGYQSPGLLRLAAALSELADITAVSYTHLDVYKRQALASLSFSVCTSKL